jgi:hypothetical protein
MHARRTRTLIGFPIFPFTSEVPMAKKTARKKTAAKVKLPEKPTPVWTNNYTNENQIWLDLLTNNIKRVKVYFSGGNDEGGADMITLIYDDAGAVTTDIDAALHSKEDPAHEISNALAEPVYDEYGSFAGDFNINGVIIWDVNARTILLDGAFETTTSEAVEKTLHWSPPKKYSY